MKNLINIYQFLRKIFDPAFDPSTGKTIDGFKLAKLLKDHENNH